MLGITFDVSLSLELVEHDRKRNAGEVGLTESIDTGFEDLWRQHCVVL